MNAPSEATLYEQHVAKPGKYLTFMLGQEEYGLEILAVQEIIGALPVTRVPRTPAFILGVINLRGRIIPVIDLRERLQMPPAVATDGCIIVVKVAETAMGVMVDKVSEVINLAAGDLEPTPAFGVGVNTAFLLGVAKHDGRVRLLLDIARVLTATETESLHLAASVDG